MMKHTIAVALAASACSTALAFQNEKPAADAKPVKEMTIGDKAVPIDISHWLKFPSKDGKPVVDGKPVTTFEDGKVYVLEFWATWCGPCRAGMPHLSEIQEKYQDYGVSVIGISDEPLATVVNFLSTEDTKEKRLWTSKINYTLTTDPDESVKRDYFLAAGQNGIPCAFIIGKDQHVEWIGHPMSMDEPLKAVVNDEWDRAAFKTRWDNETKAEREAMKHQLAYRDARKAGDYAKAISILDEMIAAQPDNPQYQFAKLQLLLTEANKPEDGYALANQLAKEHGDDPMMLNQLAWFVVDTPGLKKRDLDFALKTAERAVEVTKGEDAAILDTLARCHFEKGDLAKAVEIQKKAVAANAEGEMGQEIAATLKKYEDALAKKGS